MEFLDLLFPKKCVQCKKFGDYLCSDCFASISFDVQLLCLICHRPAMFGATHPVCTSRYTIDGHLASIVYQGVVKKLVYQFKYAPYITDLQKLLAALLYEGLIQQPMFHQILQRPSVLVPIPLHPVRYRKRGYNQSRILAETLAKQTGVPVVALIKRVKPTSVQANLGRAERIQNIKDAFIIDDRTHVSTSAQQVLLVDDIITSGATMVEAAKVLKKAGVKEVWGIALAHGGKL